VISFFFVHIYLGAIGMEGSLETMTTGYCDSNWAKEHHDEWYEEVKDTVEAEAVDSGGISPDSPTSTNTET